MRIAISILGVAVAGCSGGSGNLDLGRDLAVPYDLAPIACAGTLTGGVTATVSHCLATLVYDESLVQSNMQITHVVLTDPMPADAKWSGVSFVIASMPMVQDYGSGEVITASTNTTATLGDGGTTTWNAGTTETDVIGTLTLSLDGVSAVVSTNDGMDVYDVHGTVVGTMVDVHAGPSVILKVNF